MNKPLSKGLPVMSVAVFAALIFGCQKEEAVEPTVKAVEFPKDAKFPTEIVGQWEKTTKSQKITFGSDGNCDLSNKIMSFSGGAGPGGQSVDSGKTKEMKGKWGTEGDQFFLQVDGQPTIKYRFEVKGSTLDLYTGKIKDSYQKLK